MKKIFSAYIVTALLLLSNAPDGSRLRGRSEPVSPFPALSRSRSGGGWGGTAWAEEFSLAGGSLYSDIRAHKIGDILTVLIVESSSAKHQTGTATKKGNELSLSSGPGLGGLNFIPLYGWSGKLENKYDGAANTARSGELKARITVRVKAVRPNGDLMIEGTRIVQVNNEKEEIVLSGVVRPKDVSASNTVYSYLIADANIAYKGKGAVNTGARPGFLMRIVNWIF